MTDVGTVADDRLVRLGNFNGGCIKTNVCEQINRGFGLSISPIENQTSFSGPVDAYLGKYMACHDIINIKCYWFYAVLYPQ